MSTNGYTRDFIVEQASEMASQVGLTGLSFSVLARRLRRPKSTVFFHFRSMEALQLGVLDNAARELMRLVVRPAFFAPEGLPRLDRLFSLWLAWDGRAGYPGGCPFVAGASEFDDRPSRVRDLLLRLLLGWQQLIRVRLQRAIAAGTLRPDTDCEQFLHDLHGIMLAYHHARRLLREPDAERRAMRAYEGLVGRVRNGN